MKNKKINWFMIFVCVVSLTLLSFTIYRAATTNITYDEAFTYLEYVYKKPYKVFSHIFINGTLANNHLLNSFLISVINSVTRLEFNEIIIRTPNIIFYVIYFVFCYLVTKDSKYKYGFFSMLAFNYGANEFFGLARGYGMSCSLVLIGVYFFKKYLLSSGKHGYLSLSYIFLLLACYANTVALIPFGAIIVSSVIVLTKNKTLLLYIKKQLFILLPVIILSLLIVKYHFMVSGENLPLYGGNTSFYKDVLVSYFDIYGLSFRFVKYFIGPICLVIVLVALVNVKRLKNNFLVISGLIYFVLLVIITLATKNMWTTGRCLIPSMPLVIIMIEEILETLNFKKTWMLDVIIVIPLLISFGKNLNLKQTREWNYTVRLTCYEAYEKKDNSIINRVRDDYATNFYWKKILKEKNYDIYR